MQSWQKTKFLVRAEIEFVDKTVCFDVVSFSSQFEMNAIPAATLGLAVGRRADDVSKIAEIHFAVDNLKLQLPVRVLCKAENQSGENIRDEWPAGEFVIFEGFTTGMGFQRTSQGASFTLFCIHWLSDLHFASSVSKQSHPMNPGNMFFPAAFSEHGGTLNREFLPAATFATFINEINIQQDFWGRAIKPLLLALSKTDRINSAQIRIVSPVTSSFDPGTNEEALRALNRFEPFEKADYVLGVPVRMTAVSPGLSLCLAKAIQKNIGKENQEAYVNATIWDKLVGQMQPSYLFSVIPLVSKALVVPFIPGQNTLSHRFIEVKDYETIDLQANIPRPLRAVGVMVGMRGEYGADFSQSAGAGSATGLGGWFDKLQVATTPEDKKAFERGLVMVKNAAPWMVNTTCAYDYSRRSAGVINAISTVIGPKAGQLAATLIAQTPEQRLKESKRTWDAYARALYVFEALKGNQGTITGRVRFDIAPGSTVQIEAAQDKFISDCRDQEIFYGEVLRVSTSIDAEAARASTTFHIGHVRTSGQNADPTTSIDRHPIFPSTKWAGCVMIEEAAFGPQTTRSIGGA